MKAFVELIRPHNCAMAGVAAIIGLLVAHGILEPVGFEIARAITAFLVVFLVTGAGNAVNDYFDRDIDRVNRPERPIPSGRINPGAAHTFSMILFLGGIGLTFLINSLAMFIAGFNTFMLYFYAQTLKRTPVAGNLAVAYLTGSTFLFGGAVFGPDGLVATVGLFLLATLATLGREIVKDVEDVEGDQRAGADTIAIALGREKAARWAMTAVAAAVLLSPLPYLLGLLGPIYLGVVAAADAGFAYSIFVLQQGRYGEASQYLKISMVIGLLAFVAGGLL